ncbi:phage major capsid protein, P2 family [Dickeya solani]|uniref:Phage major capsid protein, P2 family n=1 Tax=Dickeya solani TaxID=1089444 RepID=A0ABU4EFT8_9GAMM|nr:phage major capsid protein, P2 family [Dickeya solani]MCA7001654.1 phage major capsid protein, P2 family [Dickeya solani]MCZ0821060.1 phage major capsid protein, P2 family [Dickeya solani]MDV6997435.1 phage major capsid protein, P2 family [Dickeya solani]MDV7003067.1 phage major capsid protein, P2 family [Dickeya solani]MDV7040241.1 phage major capsid protein, P2 family [Dickeya solani]
MKNETRVLWDGYVNRQAELNGVKPMHVGAQFSVAPSVQQTMENKIQASDELLKKINIMPVSEMEGEKLGLGISGPVSSSNSSSTERREPRSVHTLDSGKYRCEQTNSDTFITYSQLDSWARFKDFQARISQQIIRRKALDRIMIGFNGVSHAAKSDLAQNPLLQDVNIGWLQQYRANAPARVLKNVTLTHRDDENKVIAKGMYGNYDALVFDAVNSLLDEWFRESPDLAVITGRQLLTSRDFPILNAISTTNPNSEAMAGQLIVSRKSIANLPTFIAPYFPAGSILVTPFSNLSIYYQEAAQRRAVKDESEYNRVATYESTNDAYAVEDYGAGCLIEGITFAGSEAA